MCDRIIMPDGTVIESINGDVCLCDSSQSEIILWILKQLPEIVIDEKIEIEHSPFGYEVNIKKKFVDLGDIDELTDNEILICEWNKLECIGQYCVWYDRVIPFVGRICPVIKAHYDCVA